MKKIPAVLFVALFAISATAQTLDVKMPGVTYRFNAADCGDMTYGDNGTTLTINGKTFSVDGNSITIDPTGTALKDHCVEVAYDGTSASIVAAGDLIDSLTVSVEAAKVNIKQHDDLAQEITYTLSGNSSDGQFYMAGSYKATVELNGLNLTNTTGAPIYINNGKRIDLSVKKGTENTLTDAAASTDKGCLYCKGHLEMKGKGSLTIYAYGSKAHGIKTGEYCEMKNCTVSILAATKDGLNCNQYFTMESGTLNISGVGDDGIQVSYEYDDDEETIITADEENTGTFTLISGTINISVTATAAKAIKTDNDVIITDGTIIATTSGDGEWDSDELKTKAASCISADGNMTIDGGTLTLTSTGSGGKGINVDNTLTINGGTISVTTKGHACVYKNGTLTNGYTDNLESIDSDYKSSPKGIKAGTKTEVTSSAAKSEIEGAGGPGGFPGGPGGNSSNYTYSGGIVINGGSITVKTSGNGGEGIESKNTLDITGGEIAVESYDDAMNSAQDFTISGGTVYAWAKNNDGLDANGNFYIKGGTVYAIGASGAERAIDANTEERKQLYITGGTVIAIGGLENGASVSTKKSTLSSWNKNIWYKTTIGSANYYFKTPSSGGNGITVCGSSTPSISTGASTAGTSYCNGVLYY